MSLVLGGGIGGLASAYYLAKNGRKVTLIEASKRLGGWIRTIEDDKTGIRFDKGPRTLRVKGEPAFNTLQLIEELGIELKLKPIKFDQPSAQNRMIYVNNQLHSLPSSFSSIFKRTSPFSKPLYTTIFKDLISPAKKREDDNIYDFVERRFGKEVADYLISAMICGICAGDAKKISVKFLMPQLFNMEQKDRSVIVGMLKSVFAPSSKAPLTIGHLQDTVMKEKWSIFGFEGGMESFPRALSDRINSLGVSVNLSKDISKININSKSVKIFIGNDVIETDHITSCLPANKLALLLKEQHSELSNELGSIPFVDVAVVNLAYKGKQLQKDAFGFLIPPSQKMPILGVIFDSCNFEAGDWTVLTVMMGGAWFDNYFHRNVKDEELLDLAVAKIKEILHIDGPPSAYHVSLMKDCIPQYIVGHYDKVSRIKSYIKDNKLPLSLVGSSYTGIGVNDVILSARKAAEERLQNS